MEGEEGREGGSLPKCKQAKVGGSSDRLRSGRVRARDMRQAVGKIVSLSRSPRGSAVTLTPHSPLDPDYIFSSERYKLLDGSLPSSIPFLVSHFSFSPDDHKQPLSLHHENNWVLMLWLVRGWEGKLQQ